MLDSNLIIGYIVLCLVIGWWSGRKQTGEDFMIMNRKLGLFSFVCTVVASLIGATAMVVFTAYIFQFGIGALAALGGAAIGFTLFGLCAHRLRRLAHEHRFHTMADFFHHSFPGRLGHFVALIVMLMLLLVILKQFVGGAQVITGVSAYSYGTSLLISAGVIFVYLMMGGFRSVVKTDVFQYLAMFFLVFVIGFFMAGKTELPLTMLAENSASPSLIISFLVLGLVITFYSPDVWQRVYAAESDRVVRLGLIYSAIACLVFGVGMTLIALSARRAFPDIDPGQALVFGVMHLLPPGLAGLGAILIFAAIMSSADTYLFLIASNAAKDFIRPLKKRDLSSDELAHYTRWSLMAAILVAAGLAYFFRDLVKMALVSDALGMSLAPAIIAGFFWKLKTRAVFWSIVSGLALTVFFLAIGKFTPEAMISPIIPSAVTLFILQKILKSPTRCSESA